VREVPEDMTQEQKHKIVRDFAEGKSVRRLAYEWAVDRLRIEIIIRAAMKRMR
jgi:hypothetical protein